VVTLPEQISVEPEIAPGVAGAAPLPVIANVRAALVPQELLAVTETFPELQPIIAVMLFVVAPVVIVAPVGRVHV
jgi:hypothetical protein